MPDLDFDRRRAERGVTGGHTVTVGGATHHLPAVLPLSVMANVAQAVMDASGGKLKTDKMDAATLLRAAPGLVDAFAAGLGEWVRQLDEGEFMALFELYDLGGDGAGESSGS